jgi:hypothetical protein
VVQPEVELIDQVEVVRLLISFAWRNRLISVAVSPAAIPRDQFRPAYDSDCLFGLTACPSARFRCVARRTDGTINTLATRQE